MNREALLDDDAQVVAALKRGDDDVFGLLMDEWDSSMLRLAMVYVPSRAVAEEVLQETWLGVIRGIDRFEARSSLRTWIFRILTNIAKTRGIREGRSVPFSSLGGDEPAVDPDRFVGGHWASPPRAWEGGERLEAKETLDVIESEIAKLPPAQAVVITMRDIEGFDSEEVRNVLGVSETNQRVLLHRARSKVRRALEEYMA